MTISCEHSCYRKRVNVIIECGVFLPRQKTECKGGNGEVETPHQAGALLTCSSTYSQICLQIHAGGQVSALFFGKVKVLMNTFSRDIS